MYSSDASAFAIDFAQILLAFGCIISHCMHYTALQVGFFKVPSVENSHLQSRTSGQTSLWSPTAHFVLKGHHKRNRIHNLHMECKQTASQLARQTRQWTMSLKIWTGSSSTTNIHCNEWRDSPFIEWQLRTWVEQYNLLSRMTHLGKCSHSKGLNWNQFNKLRMIWKHSGIN